MAKKEETFVLVSLNESKAKQLAQVISNESCRKILDHLAHKKATESELAKELNVPISTVHYNLKHLLDAKLVSADEFHYSEKGKEVLHYSLSKKYVIIAPESASEGIRQKLKSLLPVAFIMAVAAGLLQYIYNFGSITTTTRFITKMIPHTFGTAGIAESAPALAKGAAVEQTADFVTRSAAPVAAEAEDRIADEVMQNLAPKVAEAAEPVKQQIITNFTNVTEKIVSHTTTPDYSIVFWFLLGAVLAIATYFIVDSLMKKMSK